MNTRLLLTAWAAAVLVAGCGGYASETEEPADTPLPTSTPVPPTQPPTDTPTPQPIVVRTEDGFRIVYLGSLEARVGGALEVAFQVLGADDQPVQGTFFATLGDPPSDSRASHGNGQLDEEGKIALTLGVNWPAGSTKLYCAFQDQVYEIAEIVVNP